jgi:hypothetical protein
MTDKHDLHFDVTRDEAGYTVTQGERLLRSGIKSAKAARHYLNAVECGALLAGARVSSTMPREVRAQGAA